MTDKGHIVLRQDDGQEILADEYGLTAEDFLDVADLVPPIAGAVAGAALAPAGAGAVLLSSLAAAGAAFGGSLLDVLTTVGPVDAQRAREIARERGPEAVLDFLLGVVGAKAHRLFARKSQTTLPEGETVGTPGQVSDAANRLEQQFGQRVPLTAAEVTGSPTLSRMESIAEKVPIASETFKRVSREKDAALAQIQNQLTGDTSFAAQNAVTALNQQYRAARQQSLVLSQQADEVIQSELARIGNALQAGGVELNKESSGVIARNAVDRARQAFRAKESELYATFRASGGGDIPVADTSAIRAFAKKQIEDVPKSQAGEPSTAFLPGESRQFLSSLSDLADKATVNELRNARTLIGDAIQEGSALPGVGQGQLKRLYGLLTKAIESAPVPQGRALLQAANKFHRENADQFLEVGISDLFRTTTVPGYVEDFAVANRVLAEGATGKFSRLWNFMSREERAAFSRGVYNDLVNKSGSIMQGTVDASRLASHLEAMPAQVRKELFGDREGEIIRITRLIGARHNLIPWERLDNLEGDVVKRLREIAREQTRLEVEYSNDVLKPFLRDEIGRTAIDPAEFVSHVLNRGSLEDLKAVLVKLGRDSDITDGIRRKTVQLILTRATRPATAEDVITGLVERGQPIVGGKEILKALKEIGGEQSEAKLAHILGDDLLRSVKDIGIVRGAQQRRADVGAAGGLMAGFMISALLRGNLTQLPIIGWYKVQSLVLTNPVILSRLRTQFAGTQSGAISSTVIAQFSNDIAQEFQDEPGLEDLARERLAEMLGLPQLRPGEAPVPNTLLGPTVDDFLR